MRIEIRFAVILIVVLVFGGCLHGNEIAGMTPVAVSELSEDAVFSVFTSLTVGPKGNVFCLAKKENRILKFNPGLKFVTQFAETGKGPGSIKIEFWSPAKDRLSIIDNGDVYFFDENPGRLIIFDNKGKYKKDINIQRNLVGTFQFIFAVKAVTANLFTARVPSLSGSQNSDVVFFQLKPFSLKFRHANDQERIHFKHKSFMVSGIAGDGYGASLKVLSDSEKIVVAKTQRFRLYIYDTAGKKLSEIYHTEKKMTDFTDNELLKVGERFSNLKEKDQAVYNKLMRQFKGKKNVISDVKIDKGRIFVFPVRDDITAGGGHPYILYDLKGQEVAKGVLGKIPHIIRHGYAYFVDSETGANPSILKYRIKNRLIK